MLETLPGRRRQSLEAELRSAKGRFLGLFEVATHWYALQCSSLGKLPPALDGEPHRRLETPP